MDNPKGLISVIVPALDEEKAIGAALEAALDACDVEVIVSDGGSTDKTAVVVRGLGARFVVSRPGRAAQMNAGASLAQGDFLVFLHADTLLPKGYDARVRDILGDRGVAAGAFRLGIGAGGTGFRAIERFANWRSKFLGMPYGDQAIFVRTRLFRLAGGFPEIPIMEDFEFMRRIRSLGRIELAGAAAVTSPRRWCTLGILRTTLINQIIIAAFCLGVRPDRLARWYGRRGAD
jgi:rSAM/selenodomain-associated transferase 2